MYFLMILVFVCATFGNDHEKRLLINDPDAILSRLTKMEARIANLETELAAAKSSSTNGATFVRWGKSQCPVNTELVYKGYGGGQRYFHIATNSYYGGPANILCLPDNPEYTNETLSTENILEGVEFEGYGFSHDAPNEDMPCSVCRSPSAGSTIMIPGRKTCYGGWTQQYTGVLGSGHIRHSPSMYICVDEHPDYIVSGQSNDGGRELYVVGYKCGSLPCPPYHDNRKVLCVVCSK